MSSSTSGLEIPLDNDWEYLHGRVDPGQDESLSLVESVAVPVPEITDLEQRNNLSSSKEKDESCKVPQPRSLLGMPNDSSTSVFSINFGVYFC
jgi:hypothetical protein